MLRKAMSVLTLYTQSQTSLGVTEAAELLDRPKSTVSRWLNAMADAEFLRKDPASQQFYLDLRLVALGERYTARTVPTVEVLLQQLKTVRERGYSTSGGEFEKNLVAVCAPVRDGNREVVAAASVAAPASRLPEEQMPLMAKPVMAAAKKISTALGYQPPASEDGGIPPRQDDILSDRT